MGKRENLKKGASYSRSGLIEASRLNGLGQAKHRVSLTCDADQPLMHGSLPACAVKQHSPLLGGDAGGRSPPLHLMSAE